jgi:hypothetical protein
MSLAVGLVRICGRVGIGGRNETEALCGDLSDIEGWDNRARFGSGVRSAGLPSLGRLVALRGQKY